MAEAITDETLRRALGLYVGMVDRVLGDPERWLGVDDDPDTASRLPAKVAHAVRDKVFGGVTPASPRWANQPLERRVDWWVTRIGFSAGLAAAAPRFAGMLADRLPLQAALGASASGLAVCATAREHGRTEPADWVPLLSKVLFDRELAPAAETVPDPERAETELATATDGEPDDGTDDQPEDAAGAGLDAGSSADPLDADPLDAEPRDEPADGEPADGEPDDGEPADGEPADGDPDDDASRLALVGRGAKTAARTLWRLARAFLEIGDLLDERPRGNLVFRGVGKLPVVGLAGGFLDERGGIRRASRETGQLIDPTIKSRWPWRR